MEMMINAAKAAYMKVFGEAKWNGLSTQEQHDAVMFIIQDFGKILASK